MLLFLFIYSAHLDEAASRGAMCGLPEDLGAAWAAAGRVRRPKGPPCVPMKVYEGLMIIECMRPPPRARPREVLAAADCGAPADPGSFRWPRQLRRSTFVTLLLCSYTVRR